MATRAKKAEAVLAWHFVGAALRDGRPIPADGEWLRHDGECVMCETGLHASRRLIDALQYAPGSTICRVAVRGIAAEDENDKLVARERVILWRLTNADDLLCMFARKAALSVIHLWNAPAVVKQYLETGDEKLKDAAWDAAWAAARAAARDAAWAAALAYFNSQLEQMVTEAAGSPNTDALLKNAAAVRHMEDALALARSAYEPEEG
jgi:hypothetical protein